MHVALAIVQTDSHFSVVLRFGFPLLLSRDVLSDLKSLFTLLLVVY